MPDELTQEQKDALLQSGQQDREERKDPSDNLTPDHPRFKDVIAKNHELNTQMETLKQQMEELKQNINTRQEATGDDELTVDEEKALDRIYAGLRAKKGVLTEADLRVEKRANEYGRLVGKYDGSNGLPKFVAIDVETHAKKNGYGDNYEAAYKDLHHDAIVQVEAKRMTAPPPNPTQIEKGRGDREIKIAEFTPEAIAQMSEEEYDKNRPAILAAMRNPS